MFAHLGIIAPTFGEASLLLERLDPEADVKIGGKTFLSRLHAAAPRVTLCVSGVGKANAAHGTTLLIERFRPDLICLIGIGGAYPSAKLAIGDIVAADYEIYGDEGVESAEGFVSLRTLGLPLLSEGCLRYFNEIPLTLPSELGQGIRTGPFVTVSTCTGTLRRGLEMERRFPGAICENMEGAAFAHVCRMSVVSAFEVRAISNIIEDRSPGGLDRDSMRLAASRVQTFLLERMPAALIR